MPKGPILKIFALSDPHLALATPGKEMDRFGEQWRRHPDRIAAHWREVVGADDLVLVPGDISWAMKLQGAEADLRFLADLPGHKVLLRGNHDYWWASASKVRRAVGESFSVIHGDALVHRGVVLGGSRLWDVPGLRFEDAIDWQPGEGDELRTGPDPDKLEQDRRVFERELGRLDRALAQLQALGREHPTALRIALTHYPPCGPRLEPSVVSERFTRAGVRHVVFGHLHSVKRVDPPWFGALDGVQYHLCSCDYLDFRPKLIDEVGG